MPKSISKISNERRNVENDGKKSLELKHKSEDGNDNMIIRWLNGLAIFGDSDRAVIASFFLMMVSIVMALWVDGRHGKEFEIGFDPLDMYVKVLDVINPPYIFEFEKQQDVTEMQHFVVTAEMRSKFEKDGVIAVRGLIPKDLLDRLDAASTELIMEKHAKKNEKPKGAITGRKKPGKQFHTVQLSAIYKDPPPSSLDSDDNTTRKMSPFLELALLSEIPAFAADLLNLRKEENETMRLMKDIFLSKDEEEYTCGWHVDDTGFWPATANAPGVNAWVALDDMPKDGGGGFALATGSHTAPWRDEAYFVTGSTHTYPTEGYRSAKELFANRPGNGTCNIKTAAPHLYRRMELSKRIYDIKRGDVIFHTRWLFHRTVPFERDIVEARRANKSLDELLYRRYSLRYSPGYSVIPRGFGTEPSVLWDKSNGGRTADEVSHHDGPWYPRVWPTISTEEFKQMEDLVERKIPVAEQRAEINRKQMRPFLKKMG